MNPAAQIKRVRNQHCCRKGKPTRSQTRAKSFPFRSICTLAGLEQLLARVVASELESSNGGVPKNVGAVARKEGPWTSMVPTLDQCWSQQAFVCVFCTQFQFEYLKWRVHGLGYGSGGTAQGQVGRKLVQACPVLLRLNHAWMDVGVVGQRGCVEG